MRPIIGILATVDDELVSSVNNKYIEAVECSGGLPMLLPYVESDGAADEFVRICDGILFTGGVDISPARYGEEKKPTCGNIQLKRDELDFKVIKKALAADKPIIAICRGAQLVNVALGGSLYQDIPTETDSQISHRQTEGLLDYSHDVNVLAQTPLYALMGTERIRANSFHHQAVKRLGAGLKVMATADDGVIEAVYHENMSYLRAYQWHPERLYGTDSFNRKIFDDFIEYCRHGKNENSFCSQ